MLSLDKLMQKVNSKYYKQQKPTLYYDFLTYTQSKKNLLGQACASSFYSHLKFSKNKKLNVLEIGVGNGNFAFSFLEKLKTTDKIFLKKVNYFLADFSIPLLNLASKNLEKFSKFCTIKNILFDANNFSKFKLKEEFDCVLANELLSDLAAKIFVKKEDNCVYEVYYNKNLNFQVSNKKKKLSKIENRVFSYFPKNFFIPINFLAKNLIFFLSKKLKKTGYMQFFDYGFYKKEDFILDQEDWNKFIVRKYGEQITVDLNFYYLFQSLKFKKIFSKVLRQKEYIKNSLSQKISLVQRKNGLNYSFKKEEFEEEDYFYTIFLSKSNKKFFK